jgi:hypothetical protein
MIQRTPGLPGREGRRSVCAMHGKDGGSRFWILRSGRQPGLVGSEPVPKERMQENAVFQGLRMAVWLILNAIRKSKMELPVWETRRFEYLYAAKRPLLGNCLGRSRPDERQGATSRTGYRMGRGSRLDAGLRDPSHAGGGENGAWLSTKRGFRLARYQRNH